VIPEQRHNQSGVAGERTSLLVTLLGRTYGLARILASAFGDDHLGWVASDRYVAIAERSVSPVEQGAAAVHRAAGMLAMHYLWEAHSFAIRYADCLTSPAELPLRGALLLQAAAAAAELDQHEEAHRLLVLARAIAEAMGSDEVTEFISFGPTAVGISEIQIAMRLGKLSAALRLARNVSLPVGPSIEQHASYLITIAHAYMRARDDVAAVFALNRVSDLSPEDLRFNPLARHTIQRLAQRDHVLVAADVKRLSGLLPGHTGRVKVVRG